MQNIKKPCREPYISRERDPQSGASGGRLVLGVLELLSTINIVELKKMASPSVPSVSRVETSSEYSSDSTSTTTSTVSEHSKTSNIINRYSCSVERGLYWVPYGFRWFDLDSTRFTRPVQCQWQRLSVRSTRPVAYPSTGYLFQLQGTFQAVKLKATTWPRGEFPLLPDDGSRVGNSKHRMVFLRQLSKRWLQYPGTDCIASR